jgi:hypothetical protein
MGDQAIHVQFNSAKATTITIMIRMIKLTMTREDKSCSIIFQRGPRQQSHSKWNNKIFWNIMDKNAKTTLWQSFSSEEWMTWPGPTTGLTPSPTQMWQTISRGLPVTDFSPHLRCSTGKKITLTNLKPRFQRQFAKQSDDKLIVDGLFNLAMKPNESTGKLLARITNTMVIIKESNAAYENKVAAQPIKMPTGAT